MSEVAPDTLETGRAWAQRVTIAAAVVTLLFWLLSLATKAGWADTMAGLFSGITCVGGFTMGVLYLVHNLKERG